MDFILRIAIWSLLILSSITTSIVLINCTQIVKRARHQTFVAKRRPNIVLHQLICGIVVNLIGLPMTIYIHFDFNQEIVPDKESDTFLILDVINDWLYTPWAFGERFKF